MIRQSEVVTGIFILVGLLILFAVAIVPLERTLFAADNVVFVAKFQDVALLEEKARVTVNGLQVGTVQTIEIRPSVQGDDSGGGVLVVFDMEPHIAEKLRNGTRAEIKQESLLGAKYLRVIPDTRGEPLPKDADGRLVVAGEPYGDMFTMLDELREQIKPLIANTNTMIENINQRVLAEDKMDQLWGLVTDTRTTVKNLNDTIHQLRDRVLRDDGIIDRGEKLLGAGNDVVAHLDESLARLEQKLTDTLANADALMGNTNGAVTDIRSTLSEMRPKVSKFLDTANSAVSKLETKSMESMEKLDDVLDGTNDLVRNPDLLAALYELRRTLQESRLLVMSLRADPSQVIFGGPGEVKAAAPPVKDLTPLVIQGRPQRYDQ